MVKQLLEAGADKDVQDKVRPRGLQARLRAWRRGAWGAADLRGGGGGGGLWGDGMRVAGWGPLFRLWERGDAARHGGWGNYGATVALIGAAGRAALALLVPAPLAT